jgi:hypothetical protein
MTRNGPERLQHTSNAFERHFEKAVITTVPSIAEIDAKLGALLLTAK